MAWTDKKYFKYYLNIVKYTLHVKMNQKTEDLINYPGQSITTCTGRKPFWVSIKINQRGREREREKQAHMTGALKYAFGCNSLIALNTR